MGGLSKALDQASAKVSDFAKKSQDMGKKISDTGKTMSLWVTGPIAAVSTAILALGVNVGNVANDLLTLEAQTGISTDSLQDWAYASVQAGGSAKAVESAIFGLSRKMPELANDTGEGAKALERLGLQFSDIADLAPEKVFELLLERLSTIPNVLERNATASKVLGLGWKEVSPIIAEGADKIAALRQEAHDLGVVIDREGLVQADQFRRAWDSVKAQFGAVKNEIGIEFAPLLENTLIPLLRDRVIPFVKDVASGIKGLVEGFLALDPKMRNIILLSIGIVAVIGPVLVIVGKLTTAIGLLSSALVWLAANPIVIVIAAVAALVTAWATAQEGLETIGDWILEFFIDLNNSLIAIWNGWKTAVESVVNGIIAVLNLIPGVHIPKLELAMSAYVASLENAAAQTDLLASAIGRLGESLEDVDKIRYDQLIAELKAVGNAVASLPADQAAAKFKALATDILDKWATIYPELSLLTDQFLTDIEAAAAQAQLAIAGSAVDAIKDAKDSAAQVTGELGDEFNNLLLEFGVTARNIELSIDKSLQAIQDDFIAAYDAVRDADAGTIGWANAVQAFLPIYQRLVDYQDVFTAQTGEANAEIQLMIDRAGDLGIKFDEVGPKALTLAEAIAKLAESARDSVEQSLNKLVNSVQSIFSTFFDGIVDMKKKNAELLEDYQETLRQVAEAEGQAVKDASDTRARGLRELADSLADGRITREQYAREYAQIESDYTDAVTAAVDARAAAQQEEKLAYEQQKVGIGDILGDMLGNFLRAAREELQLQAAKEAVLAAANALLLNWAGAGQHALASAAYLAGAAGLAIAGFDKGGIVAGALGEPVPAIVHGGEMVLTQEQQRGIIDYDMMTAAFADALEQVLPERGRPLYITTDGKAWAKAHLPYLQLEEKRLGLVMP